MSVPHVNIYTTQRKVTQIMVFLQARPLRIYQMTGSVHYWMLVRIYLKKNKLSYSFFYIEKIGIRKKYFYYSNH